MRILIFGNYHGGKVFFDELSEWLSRIGYKVDLLDWGTPCLYYHNFNSVKIAPESFLYRLLHKVPSSKIRYLADIFLIMKTIRSVPQYYDIINIHYGNARNNKFIKLLKRKGKKLVVTIWGSDYHRVKHKQRQKARKLYEAVDIINFGNPEMRDDFLNYYSDYHVKAALAGFGVNKFYTIEKLLKDEDVDASKRALNIPVDSFIITCGYKAFNILQHFKIIEAIEKMRNYLPQNYLLVFPLTYHKNSQYINELKHKLDKSNLRYIAFEEFLTEEDISRLRIISNIYITIPVSDAASASMLEYLLCGNVVIAGNWLPYKFWEDLGLFFLRVDEHELSDCIVNVIDSYEDYKQKTIQNRMLIMENLTWEKKIQDWKVMFEKIN